MRSFKTAAATAAFVFATAGAAHAQLSIGAKIGANLANLEDAEVADSDARTGLIGGGFLRFGFGSAFSIQPELMYSPKGAKRLDVDAPGGASVGLQLDYVQIPVLLRYDFQFDPFRPYLIAGPYGAFEVSCTQTDPDNEDVEADCVDEVEGQYKRRTFDWGVTAGGGLSFGMGPGRLLLEARYDIGMQDLFDNESPGSIPFEDIETRTGTLLVGFEVGLR